MGTYDLRDLRTGDQDSTDLYLFAEGFVPHINNRSVIDDLHRSGLGLVPGFSLYDKILGLEVDEG